VINYDGRRSPVYYTGRSPLFAEHCGREEARRADLSASAETCWDEFATQDSYFVLDGVQLVRWSVKSGYSDFFLFVVFK